MKKMISNFKINIAKYAKEIKKLSSAVYSQNATILYTGQKPLAAILVIDGIVNIKKNRKVVAKFLAGSIIAHTEFLFQTSIAYDVEIVDQTKIAWIDKSFITKIKEEDIDENLRKSS